MSWFQRRAQAESDRAALAAALQHLDLRLERLEMRFEDARAEASARQDSWRSLTERVGRAEVGQHTIGTQMANHSAVAVVLDSRLVALERRLTRDYHDLSVALDERLAALPQGSSDPATMLRLSNEVARLDIEFRAELARAVNRVSTLVGPAYTNGNGNGNGTGTAPTEIDLREHDAEVEV